MSSNLNAKVVSVASQKGGVGKTTTCHNLGTSLGWFGVGRILLIDMDPQANLSTGMGIDYDKRHNNMYSVLTSDINIRDAIASTSIDYLDLIPATVDLAAAELEIIGLEYWQFIMRSKIDLLRSEYRYIIIDCPPSLGALTINSLSASDSVLIPLQCEFFALEGLSHLLSTVGRVQKHLNPHLKISGVLLTMYDKRSKLSQSVAQDVSSVIGDMLYKTIIPRNVRLSEAPSHGKAAIHYAPASSGSQAYLDLAREILQQDERQKLLNEYSSTSSEAL